MRGRDWGMQKRHAYMHAYAWAADESASLGLCVSAKTDGHYLSMNKSMSMSMSMMMIKHKRRAIDHGEDDMQVIGG